MIGRMVDAGVERFLEITGHCVLVVERLGCDAHVSAVAV
jgi:hypothetical protein